MTDATVGLSEFLSLQWNGVKFGISVDTYNIIADLIVRGWDDLRIALAVRLPVQIVAHVRKHQMDALIAEAAESTKH